MIGRLSILIGALAAGFALASFFPQWPERIRAAVGFSSATAPRAQESRSAEPAKSSVEAKDDQRGVVKLGEAGVVFEGDRRFQIVVRLADAERNNIEVLKNLPVALPEAAPGAGATMVPLRQFASFRFSEGPNQISRDNGKRRVVVTANVRGRDMGSLVEEAQAKISDQVKLPPGYWVVWGGQFENLVSAQQRLFIVVPICFALVFLLLLGSLGSARDALLVFKLV